MNEVIDHETGEVTGLAVREDNVPMMMTADPVQNFRQMRALVSEVSAACTGKAFRANIQGKDYPTVQWWTTVGASLGMFPYEVWSKKIEDDNGKMAYESFVEVRRNGVAITSASAICSTGERTWSSRDEYAIKSMATTRATAKAYRLGLSFLAVLAGLEATPAEEMPREPDAGRYNAPPRTPVNPEKVDAMNALYEMYGDDREAKLAYIRDITGREEISHPDDVDEAEWPKVKASVVEDLANQLATDDRNAEAEYLSRDAEKAT